MTWRDFKDLVLSFMPVHSRREGIRVLINQYIRAAVADLQLVIPAIQPKTTRVLTPAHFVASGLAARARLPAGVTINDVFSRDSDEPAARIEHRVADSPSELYLILNAVPHEGIRWVHFDAPLGVLTVAPSPIESNYEVVVSWHGGVGSYDDSDDVPFTERHAEAVSEFVLSRLARSVEKDLALSQSHEGSYRWLKRLIYLRHKEEAVLPDQR